MDVWVNKGKGWKPSAMRPDDLTTNASGSLERNAQGNWTFVPNPLPPEVPWNAALAAELARAHFALGELAGLGRNLPNPHLLIRPFLQREAELSSRIEGTRTELGQLMLFAVEPSSVADHDDAEEVSNYVKALEYGLQAMQDGVPFSFKLLCELHALLLHSVRGQDKRPGQLRDRRALIGSDADDFESARFVPPCHTAVRPLLGSLIDFLQKSRDLPAVVHLAMAHYQFEAIHPFNDGNGRLGRLLIALLLAERRVLPQPLLYLSAYFERNRQEYYDRLLAVSAKGDWLGWLTFVTRGVTAQARDAARRVRRLADLREGFRRRALELSRSAKLQQLVEQLFATPFFSVNMAKDWLGISFKSANDLVRKLEDAKIVVLHEHAGTKRGVQRVFLASAVLEALLEPLPPEGD